MAILGMNVPIDVLQQTLMAASSPPVVAVHWCETDPEGTLLNLGQLSEAEVEVGRAHRANLVENGVLYPINLYSRGVMWDRFAGKHRLTRTGRDVFDHCERVGAGALIIGSLEDACRMNEHAVQSFSRWLDHWCVQHNCPISVLSGDEVASDMTVYIPAPPSRH